MTSWVFEQGRGIGLSLYEFRRRANVFLKRIPDILKWLNGDALTEGGPECAGGTIDDLFPKRKASWRH